MEENQVREDDKMVTAHHSNEKYLTAKSTDTKPTVGVPDGIALLETDTGDVFFFDEETKQWLPQ